MKLRRRPLLVEPPAMAAPDIAFILIVFFLVCASVQPDHGRSQTLPRAEESESPEPESRTLEVSISRGAVAVGGELVAPDQVRGAIAGALRGKSSADDRIVIVQSSGDVPYERWIAVTEAIESAGGIITFQLEETREVTVD